MKYFRIFSIAFLVLLDAAGASAQQPPTVESVFRAIVGVTAEIDPEARTAQSLGTLRDGHGVVIGGDGLVLTIGYLILEADWVVVTTGDGMEVPAQVVAYDHGTGFGLVRTESSLGIDPIPLGDSDAAQAGFQVLAAGSDGPRFARPAEIVSRRTFTGYWEYLLEDAIFTMPPYPIYGGAALIDPRGQLVGIGSLLVNDARAPGEAGLGNMFVPINELKPILDELLARGRAGAPRAWLGLYTEETPTEGLYVNSVAEEGPAYKAGIAPGSVLIGLEGEPIASQEDFYRRVWAAARPGEGVRVLLLDHAGNPREVEIVTGDRYDWLRLKPGN